MSDVAAEVDFYLYRTVEFSDEILSECGSRGLSRPEAGKRLHRWMEENGKWALEDVVKGVRFTREQIICANEVFPESAVADPIADLEVWEEWRSGYRKFPYPGIYPRLRIRHQRPKTTSKTSIGVIGEIFTGLFAQNLVAPRIMVRPINSWPDFIFLSNNGEYSFVEAKASEALHTTQSPAVENFSSDLLTECLGDAVQELNAESFLRVWLSFTEIVKITPHLRVRVYFIETRAPDVRRGLRQPNFPTVIAQEVAEQLFSSSVVSLDGEVQKVGEAVRRAKPKERSEVDKARRALLKKLRGHSLDSVNDAVPTALPQEVKSSMATAVSREIQKINFGRSFDFKSEAEGQRLIGAKVKAAQGQLACLRQVGSGDQWLMIAELPLSSVDKMREYKIRSRGLQLPTDARLSFVTEPWGWIDDLQLWRCSHVVVAIGSRRYEGRSISEARRT